MDTAYMNCICNGYNNKNLYLAEKLNLRCNHDNNHCAGGKDGTVTEESGASGSGQGTVQTPHHLFVRLLLDNSNR